MAEEATGNQIDESELQAVKKHEKVADTSSADSSTQLKSDGSFNKKIVGDKGKQSLLMFSRSAETVGNTRADQKQYGQRPDRLHARRPSTYKRGGLNEQSQSGSRCAGSKVGQRVPKAAKIRTSKSCTKECEILRADYGSDYSTVYSALYEDLLRNEESKTCTGVGEESEAYEQEDVTLSESTALAIDTDDLDAKSDMSISSQDDTSLSLGYGKTALQNGYERPGNSRCGQKKDTFSRNSDECLDSEYGFTEWEQHKRAQNHHAGHESITGTNEGETSQNWDTWNDGTEDVQERNSSSEGSDRLHENKCEGVTETVTLSKLHKNNPSNESPAKEDSTCNTCGEVEGSNSTRHPYMKNSLRSECLENATDMSLRNLSGDVKTSSDIHHEGIHIDPASHLVITSSPTLIKNNSDLRGERTDGIQASSVDASVISLLNLKLRNQKDKEQSTDINPSDERSIHIIESLNSVVPSRSGSSHIQIPHDKTSPSLQYTSTNEKQVGNLHDNNPCSIHRGSTGKRAPYPEVIAKAITDAIESGHFQASQLIEENGRNEYLVQIVSNSEASVLGNNSGRLSSANAAIREHSLVSKKTEKNRADTPGLSILSFNPVKEMPEMPSRPDHNDIYHGDRLFRIYPSSSPASPSSSTTSDHHVAVNNPVGPQNINQIPSECIQKQRSRNIAENTPLNGSLTIKAYSGHSGCKFEKPNELHDMCAHSSCQECTRAPQEQIIPYSRLKTESSDCKLAQANLIELGFEVCSRDGIRSQDLEINNNTGREIGPGKLEEALGVDTQSNDGSNKVVLVPMIKSARRSLVEFSVPSLGTHEYLPFLNKLRKDAAIKREANRQQNKINKSQRKLSENAKKTTTASEDELHGDAESMVSIPVCPIGREVPPDWKPGEHSSHPLTKISASYTSSRRVRKQRRSVRKKSRTQSRMFTRKKGNEVGRSKETDKHFEVTNNLQQNPLQHVKPSPVIHAFDASSTDTDCLHDGGTGTPLYQYCGSFEYKRRYYERMTEIMRTTEAVEGKNMDSSPVPKRITSQVRLLKTLDELYSPPSSDEAEGEVMLTDQSNYDINHQTSLFNYYTTRLQNLSLSGKVTGQETVTNTIPLIRIRKAAQEMPSALDHKRLRSLYDNRTRKSTMTSKPKKMDLTDENPNTVVKNGQYVSPSKGYSRASLRPQHSPRVACTKIHTPEISNMYEEIQEPNEKEFLTSIEKPLSVRSNVEAAITKMHHTSYLDILKANHRSSSNPQTESSNARMFKSSGAESTLAKEIGRSSCSDEYIAEKASTLKDKDCVSRQNKMKVRFADPWYVAGKERAPWRMSYEDTWCSTVNAMLLRANQVMDDSIKNDHRYPKPDSARVVSPVPPKSPTFLKELLKQDTIERKQARGHIKLERKVREAVLKLEKQDSRKNNIPTPPPQSSIPAPATFIAVVPHTESSSVQTNSSLVYTVPVKDGTQQMNMNEKSAGVLKISIQMSKRAQERAWLTHERLKRQRSSTFEQELPSETKTLPKKLAPLRISKPVNFQNPDSRNMERLPMRDILSKTLDGYGASSQQLFQPKSTPEASSGNRVSNFLLDQHSETFHYYRGPYMYQRRTSIVPLFSDSNNNAYMKDGTDDGQQLSNSTSDHDSGSEVSSETTNVNMDKLFFFQDDKADPANESISEIPHGGNDIVALKFKMDRYGHSDFDPNYSSPNLYTTLGSFSSVKSALSAVFMKSGKVLQVPSISTTDANVNPNAVCHNVDENPQQNQKANFQTLENIQGESNSPPDVTRDDKIQTIYLSGMQCVSGTNDHGENDRCDQERDGGEGIVDNNSQSTLLEALLGYETETMTKASMRKAPSFNEENETLTVCEERADEAYRTAVSGEDESMTCGTFYLNKWIPGYLDDMKAKEKPLEQPGPQADDEPHDISEVHELVECSVNESGSQCTQDPDAIDVTKYMQDLYLAEDKMNLEEDNFSCFETDVARSVIQFPQKSSQLTVPRNTNNFGIEGTTIALRCKNTSKVRHAFHLSENKMMPSARKQKSRVAQQRCYNPPSTANASQRNKALVKSYSVKQSNNEASTPSQSMTDSSAKIICSKKSTNITNKENEKRMINLPESTNVGFSKNSESQFTLYEKVFKDFEEEYWYLNKTEGRYFNWEKVKVPPTFIRGRKMFAMPKNQESITWTEVFKAASVHSVDNDSFSSHPQTNNEATGEREDEEVSLCVSSLNVRGDVTPNNVDSIHVPPNSVCTIINTRDADAKNVKKQKPSEVSKDERIFQSSNMQEIELNLLEVRDDTGLECKHFHQRSHLSEIKDGHERETNRGRSPGESSLGSSDACDTISQISDAFTEDKHQLFGIGQGDENERGAVFGTAQSDRDACGSVLKEQDKILDTTTGHDSVQDLLPEREQISWYKLTKHLKLQHICSFSRPQIGAPSTTSQNLSTQMKKRNKQKLPADILNRSFLKTLRSSDLLHTVSLDKRRLLKSLRQMTRRQGYLPVFQVRSTNSVEMMPLVVSVFHCASSFIEKRCSPISDALRSLPVFYTDDEGGFITSIYTVNWIPEGVYSLEKTDRDELTVEDSSCYGSEEAHFGRLMQYSPFVSDLAFRSDRAYLIGDEVTSREDALKILIAGHDEARDDVAKYFMLICGWVPQHLMPRPITCCSEAPNYEFISGYDEYIVPVDITSSVNILDCLECQKGESPHLPIITSDAQSPRSQQEVPEFFQDKILTLPKISPEKAPESLTITSLKSPVFDQSNAEKVCSLPSICRSAGRITPIKIKQNLMLCLRCGVTVECPPALPDDVEYHKTLSLNVNEAADKEVINDTLVNPSEMHIQTLQEHDGCYHSWEVSDAGVAFPLQTKVIVKPNLRDKCSFWKRKPNYSSGSQTCNKMSLKRKAQSATTFPSSNKPESLSLPYVKSQPNMSKKRWPLHCLTIPAGKTQKLLQEARSPIDEKLEKSFLQNSRKTPTSASVMSKTKEDNVNSQTAQVETSYIQEYISHVTAPDETTKAQPASRLANFQQKHAHKATIIAQKSQSSMLSNHMPLKHLPLQATMSSVQQDKERAVTTEALVTGWSCNTTREVTEDEKDLMEKRTWTQPVIPPPFPPNLSTIPTPQKQTQKPPTSLQLSKSHLAKHKRNLTQISHSYVSPYWSKKEVKKVRNKTPASDSDDAHSSISRITTISGMSSSSSESNTEDESSTEESESDSGSSATGSDFFTRYANKGGPTSVDDIFKRTMPRQRLNYSLSRVKELKEREEIEQLGYLRGREGGIYPSREQGDNVKDVDREVFVDVTEYDMCSDADEIKELWKLCFPEVDFWDRNRRKKFKKRKILS